ncbi:hypothetical protein DEO72_LG3g2399 [Vigna unguiculata]|uniref:Uncharacterized protein n=1 Tax=Vigna unguiculata TaxID=3917 RepID=A0A4D6LGT1_VIGUN|nr:hypothetical protein DEO72_LG3g2399 [Vigna unguiculata]
MAIHLWNKELNAMELPYGPYAPPNLFEVVAITSLELLGDTYHLVAFPITLILKKKFDGKRRLIDSL